MISGPIKDLIKAYIDNAKLSDLFFGNIVNENPLTVKIDNGLEVTQKFLEIPESLVKDTYEVEYQGQLRILKFNDIKLKKGDKVALLRAMGGQKYYILDKVVIN